jgi:hypothetical protein
MLDDSTMLLAFVFATGNTVINETSPSSVDYSTIEFPLQLIDQQRRTPEGASFD